MDQRPASLARIQIQFYISEIARRDHKITLLQDTLARLKTTLQEKQALITQLTQKHSAPTLLQKNPLKDKEETIIGLMAQVNREKEAKLSIKQQLDLLQEEAGSRLEEQMRRASLLEDELADCKHKLRGYEGAGIQSKRFFEPLKQKCENTVKPIEVKYKPSSIRQRLVTYDDDSRNQCRKQSFNLQEKRLKTQQPCEKRYKNASVLVKKASISYDCRAEVDRPRPQPRKSEVFISPNQCLSIRRPFK